jgi:hypothetical protein
MRYEFRTSSALDTPGRLRIEFKDAIYHVMGRANARQKIVRDDADRRRLTDRVEQAVVRYGWQVLCYVIIRGIAARIGGMAGPFPSRQRAQPDAPARSAAEGVAATGR